VLKGGFAIQLRLVDKARTAKDNDVLSRALRAYVKLRGTHLGALWLTAHRERLTYWGLRSMLTRRAKETDIAPPFPQATRAAHETGALHACVQARGVWSIPENFGKLVIENPATLTRSGLAGGKEPATRFFYGKVMDG
jgi:hypothetical protein